MKTVNDVIEALSLVSSHVEMLLEIEGQYHNFDLQLGRKLSHGEQSVVLLIKEKQ